MVNTLLIGLGNDMRRDDGVGLYIARRLKALQLAGVSIVEERGDVLGLMECWRPDDAVYLFDAVLSGGAPGTIVEADPRRTPLPGARHCSTHLLSLQQTFGLAAVLGRLPASLTVIGIEAGDLSQGAGLSPVVRTAAERVVQRMRDRLEPDRE